MTVLVLITTLGSKMIRRKQATIETKIDIVNTNKSNTTKPEQLTQDIYATMIMFLLKENFIRSVNDAVCLYDLNEACELTTKFINFFSNFNNIKLSPTDGKITMHSIVIKPVTSKHQQSPFIGADFILLNKRTFTLKTKKGLHKINGTNIDNCLRKNNYTFTQWNDKLTLNIINEAKEPHSSTSDLFKAQKNAKNKVDGKLRGNFSSKYYINSARDTVSNPPKIYTRTRDIAHNARNIPATHTNCGQKISELYPAKSNETRIKRCVINRSNPLNTSTLDNITHPKMQLHSNIYYTNVSSKKHNNFVQVHKTIYKTKNIVTGFKKRGISHHKKLTIKTSNNLCWTINEYAVCVNKNIRLTIDTPGTDKWFTMILTSKFETKIALELLDEYINDKYSINYYCEVNTKCHPDSLLQLIKTMLNNLTNTQGILDLDYQLIHSVLNKEHNIVPHIKQNMDKVENSSIFHQRHFTLNKQFLNTHYKNKFNHECFLKEDHLSTLRKSKNDMLFTRTNTRSVVDSNMVKFSDCVRSAFDFEGQVYTSSRADSNGSSNNFTQFFKFASFMYGSFM